MWGGMSGWSLLVFVDHLCCNQYIVGRPDGTSDQLRCCHMLPLVNLCCNQSIVGRPAGVSMVYIRPGEARNWGKDQPRSTCVVECRRTSTRTHALQISSVSVPANDKQQPMIPQ